MTELSATLRLQDSAQRFCLRSRQDVDTYHANMGSSSNLHSILTLNVLIPSSEGESPLHSGTVIYASGTLHPGTEGAMFDFAVKEYTRVDKVLLHIPVDSQITTEGVVQNGGTGDEKDLLVLRDRTSSDACYIS